MKTALATACAALALLAAHGAGAQSYGPMAPQMTPEDSREALPPELDPRQTPEELRQTRSLNADVNARIESIDRANAEADAENARAQADHDAEMARYDRERAAAETDQANYEASLRAAEAAQARYDRELAAWRLQVEDCRRGVRGACATR